MHPANIDLDRERAVLIQYVDEADNQISTRIIPHNIMFGRGSWWLEATNIETNQYTRIRMSRVLLFQKI